MLQKYHSYSLIHNSASGLEFHHSGGFTVIFASTTKQYYHVLYYVRVEIENQQCLVLNGVA